MRPPLEKNTSPGEPHRAWSQPHFLHLSKAEFHAIMGYEFHRLLYILQSQSQLLALATSACASGDTTGAQMLLLSFMCDSSPNIQPA